MPHCTTPVACRAHDRAADTRPSRLSCMTLLAGCLVHLLWAAHVPARRACGCFKLAPSTTGGGNTSCITIAVEPRGASVSPPRAVPCEAQPAAARAQSSEAAKDLPDATASREPWGFLPSSALCSLPDSQGRATVRRVDLGAVVTRNRHVALDEGAAVEPLLEGELQSSPSVHEDEGPAPRLVSPMGLRDKEEAHWLRLRKRPDSLASSKNKPYARGTRTRQPSRTGPSATVATAMTLMDASPGSGRSGSARSSPPGSEASSSCLRRVGWPRAGSRTSRRSRRPRGILMDDAASRRNPLNVAREADTLVAEVVGVFD